VAKEAFAEPTYAEIEAAGLELTDAQLLAVFNYTQSGAKALEPFRTVKAADEGAVGK